jgi:cell division protein FtsZ
LAAVGLGRRDGDAENGPQPGRAARPVPGRPADRMLPSPSRPATSASQARGPEPVSEYAKRGTHQSLDPLGRQAPVHNASEEDQLEIPAFLRRQAN